MNSRKKWDMIILVMTIFFMSLIIYGSIDTQNEKPQTNEAKLDKSINHDVKVLQNANQAEDNPFIMYISESFLSSDEIFEKSDLVVVGQIDNITRINGLEAKGASGNTIELNIPYVNYDVNIIQSLKNPTKETSILVRCMYGITNGYDPSNIKNGELYKFYLVRGKGDSYSLVSYRNGMQEFTQD